MNKNNEFTSLLGEVRALTQDAEGQLRGGFAVIEPQNDARGTNRDNNVCTNNDTCIGNDICIDNYTCTGTWKPGGDGRPTAP